jgi:hypothetical protein
MDLSRLLEPIIQALDRGSPDAAGLSAGLRSSRIGASDAAKPAVIAALAREAPGPVLVIVPKASRVQDLVEELSAWLGPSAQPTALETSDSLSPPAGRGLGGGASPV